VAGNLAFAKIETCGVTLAEMWLVREPLGGGATKRVFNTVRRTD
jgi:hypothetical protein